MKNKIELNSKEITKKELQQASATRIYNDEHAYFVTLNLYARVSQIDATNAARKLIESLSKAIFGRRSKKSLICVPVLERHKQEGYHLHLLIENPFLRSDKYRFFDRDHLKELFKSHWEAQVGAAKIKMSCKDDHSWFKDITEPSGLPGYVTKQLTGDNVDAILWDLVNENGRRWII